jgi:hypothetical protein
MIADLREQGRSATSHAFDRALGTMAATRPCAPIAA